MFVQVVRGRVGDPDAAFARLEHWRTHLSPTAVGWLGTTAGITADSELVSLVRFATAAAARRNSDRLEQGQWWAENVLLFSGDVSFDNFDDVVLVGDGGSDAAAAVELLTGRFVDRARPGLAQQLATEAAADAASAPAVIGGIVGVDPDGRFAQAIYLAPQDVGGPALDPQRLRERHTVAEMSALRLDRLWFGSACGAQHP